MSGNFFFPLAKHRETITGAKISHLKSSVRLTAAAGEGDLHALVLIGETVSSGGDFMSGPFVNRAGNTLSRVANAFSRVNERGRLGSHKLSYKDWLEHISRIKCQELLQEEVT